MDVVSDSNIPMEERRRTTRVSTWRNAFFSPSRDAGTLRDGVVLNLSSEGLLIRTLTPFPVGTPLDIELAPRDGSGVSSPMVVRGTITHVTPQGANEYAMGIRLRVDADRFLRAPRRADMQEAMQLALEQVRRMNAEETAAITFSVESLQGVEPAQFAESLAQNRASRDRKRRWAAVVLLLLLLLPALLLIGRKHPTDSKAMLASNTTQPARAPGLAKAKEEQPGSDAQAGVSARFLQAARPVVEIGPGILGSRGPELSGPEPGTPPSSATGRLPVPAPGKPSQPTSNAKSPIGQTVPTWEGGVSNNGTLPEMAALAPLPQATNRIASKPVRDTREGSMARTQNALPSVAPNSDTSFADALPDDATPSEPEAALDPLAKAATAVPSPDEVRIEVHKRDFELLVFRGNVLLKRFPVGIGEKGTTPTGQFSVTNKLTNPEWYNKGKPVKAGDRRNPLGKYWMGLSLDGVPTSYGIHVAVGPGWIGKERGQGCVRMTQDDAEALFRLSPIGARVDIKP